MSRNGQTALRVGSASGLWVNDKGPILGFNSFGFQTSHLAKEGHVDLTEVAETVLAFCAADGAALTDDMTRNEQAILDAVRKIGAKALELQMGRQ
ncbi:MAG: hypothetical protein ACKVS9_03290, partial [Phycisphaerae bacterium]